MKNNHNCYPKISWLAVLVLGIIIVVAGCSTPGIGQDNDRYTKDIIEDKLTADQDVFKVTWSPDNTKVVFIRTGKPEKNGSDEAYLWQVGEEQARYVRDVQPTTHGFSWSPDSHYFLISEKSGEGSVSTIINASSLAEEGERIISISIPVWSPDSMALAFGNEERFYENSWGTLEVYKLSTAEREYIWKARNYLYKVEFWDTEGNIGYTEINDKGQESKKTTRNIRPSISGVHLRDSMDQVRAALGNDYKETPPGEEIGHFPEKVYRWDYDKGFIIFIGAESGEVLEITATSPEAVTNLGIKMGDTAAKVFEVYRPKYIEPESIHGGIIYGLFKVEGAAALFFHFDLEEGQTLADINPQNKVERMTLTYPEILDDSF